MSPYFSYGVSKMKLVFQIHFPKTGFSEMLPLHSGKGENRSCAALHRLGRRQHNVNNSYNSFLGEGANRSFFPKRSPDSTGHKPHSVCTVHFEREPSNNNRASIFGQQRNRRKMYRKDQTELPNVTNESFRQRTLLRNVRLVSNHVRFAAD